LDGHEGLPALEIDVPEKKSSVNRPMFGQLEISGVLAIKDQHKKARLNG